VAADGRLSWELIAGLSSKRLALEEERCLMAG